MSPNAVGLVDDSGATVAADQFGAMVRGRLVVMARGSKIADGEPDAVRADQGQGRHDHALSFGPLKTETRVRIPLGPPFH